MINKKNKILLFFPNTSNRGRITTSIPILSGISKSKGWDVRYFDTTFYEKKDDSVSMKEKLGGYQTAPEEINSDVLPKSRIIVDLQKLLDEFKPDVFAITAMTCDYQFMMQFFKKLKFHKNTIIVIGGVHATFCYEDVLRTGLFDLACVGQGEETFVEILERVKNKEDISNINGTCFFDKKNKIIKSNKLRKLLTSEKIWNTELDYSLYDKRYFMNPFDGKTVNMFWLEVGRGCPFSCSYCAAPIIRETFEGRYVTSRPLDELFKVIKQVNAFFEIDIYNITHECFLMQKKSWVNEFIDRWSKEVRKPFLIQTRAESINKENLDLLKKSKAPLIQIGLGVESGSYRILKEICNKKIQIKETIEAFDLMNSEGFRTNAFFMIGLPTETREEIFETISLCKRINSKINSVNIFQPFPKLPLTNFCIDQGYMEKDVIIPDFTETSILTMPSISKEEISNLLKTFILYTKLPQELWGQIEVCEKDFNNNKSLFNKLIALRWELEDKP
jgi:radical SAM superfamily enzyme YgiQ (UPF0313 family)